MFFFVYFPHKNPSNLFITAPIKEEFRLCKTSLSHIKCTSLDYNILIIKLQPIKQFVTERIFQTNTGIETISAKSHMQNTVACSFAELQVKQILALESLDIKNVSGRKKCLECIQKHCQ